MGRIPLYGEGFPGRRWGVFGCRKDRRYFGADRSLKTALCPWCNHRHRLTHMRVFAGSENEQLLPESVAHFNAQIADDPQAQREFWTLAKPSIEEKPVPADSSCPECDGDGFHRQSQLGGGEVHELCLWCLGHGELSVKEKVKNKWGGQTEVYTGGQTGQTEGREEHLLVALGVQKVSMNQAAKDEGISITTVRRYVSRFIDERKLKEIERSKDNRRQFEPDENWPLDNTFYTGGQTGITGGGQTELGGVVPVVPKRESENRKKTHLEEALTAPRYADRLVEVQRAHYRFRLANGAAVSDSDRVTWKLNNRGHEWTQPGAPGYRYREGVVQLSPDDVKTLPGGGRVTLREQESTRAGRSFIVRLPSNLWPVELLDGGDSIESWVELAARDTGVWLSAELGVQLEYDRPSGKLEYALKTAMPPVVNKLLKGEREHFDHPDGSQVWTDDSPGEVRTTRKGHYETNSEERVRDLHELAKEVPEDAQLGDLVMDAHEGRQVLWQLDDHHRQLERKVSELATAMKSQGQNVDKVVEALTLIGQAQGQSQLQDFEDKIDELTRMLKESQLSSTKEKKDSDDMEVV